MASSSTGLSSSSSGHLDMVEIFQLLESSDLSVLDETVALVRDNLGSVTEPWLLNGLVDYYIQSGNSLARDLLCMVRQQQHKALMSKIDDYLQKVSTRLKALSLLGHIIRNEPIWTHHILTTRTFQTVLKCLQVDTDLPTITSALYVVATILPKVASQVSSYLTTICAIFVRLVSWHTIKPAGANETNLIHLHTAVYALFLCLYGMYPCFFTKYLQQHFQLGTATYKSPNGSDKEKVRIFENSVMPMLDQVRLHPRLISDSPDNELSNEKWRKIESQDIVADISKVALDATENSAVVQCGDASGNDVSDQSSEGISSVCVKTCVKGNRSMSDADHPLASSMVDQECIWSPSVAIGLSTPPPSRGMSPTPVTGLALDSSQLSARFQALQASDPSNHDDSTPSTRPLSLNMNSHDGFVPNRPHQTSSSTSTPLKHLVPSLIFSQSPSPSQHSSPRKDSERKRSLQRSGGKEPTPVNCTALTFDANSANQVKAEISNDKKVSTPSTERSLTSTKTSNVNDEKPPLVATQQLLLSSDHNIDDAFVEITVQPASSENKQDLITEFTPGLRPCEGHHAPTKDYIQQEVAHQPEGLMSAKKLLNLKNGSQYIEKSPNQLLDMHIQLVADAYAKQSDKVSVSTNKDLEWQHTDTPTSHPSTEVYLRSEVLQMHCAMLYERHRREQHALRARKLMRKVYDTTALEEKNKTMTSQLQEKDSEIEDRRVTEKAYRKKLKVQEETLNSELENLRFDFEEVKAKNKELQEKTLKLENEKKVSTDECESLRTDVSRLNSKLFTLEQQFVIDHSKNEQLTTLEVRLKEIKSQLFDAREANFILEDRIKQEGNNYKARIAESKLLTDAYARELESLKSISLKDKAQLDLVTTKAEQFEVELQKKDSLIGEQKKYLENVKSLARGQIQAMEAKYIAQKHISQRLEIQVMELFSRLSAIEGEMAVRERTHLTSGPRSIQTISALHSHGQHQHMLGSSPQLSPPIRGGLLADNVNLNQASHNASGLVTMTSSERATQNSHDRE